MSDLRDFGVPSEEEIKGFCLPEPAVFPILALFGEPPPPKGTSLVRYYMGGPPGNYSYILFHNGEKIRSGVCDEKFFKILDPSPFPGEEISTTKKEKDKWGRENILIVGI